MIELHPILLTDGTKATLTYDKGKYSALYGRTHPDTKAWHALRSESESLLELRERKIGRLVDMVLIGTGEMPNPVWTFTIDADGKKSGPVEQPMPHPLTRKPVVVSNDHWWDAERRRLVAGEDRAERRRAAEAAKTVHVNAPLTDIALGSSS